VIRAARSTAAALALSTAGGAIGYLGNLPLPWIMGAMILTTIIALSGRRLGIPKWLEFVMAAILGTMVGSAFTPNMFDGVGKWAFSIAAVVLFTIATTILISAILKRWGGFGPITAIFLRRLLET
jgi:uncharacterized membrane protein AbrB (regulator of aidB expression)